MHSSILFAAILLSVGARAGSVGVGGPCSAINSRLEPGSFKFISECSDQTFCSAAKNGTCIPRACRRDEFPFGFDEGQSLPPLCPPGFFCPDEGSGCKPLSPAGSRCQLNRDEQCAPPDLRRDWASSQNFNGSICLRFTCMHANASLGQTCVKDSTTYMYFGPDGEPYKYTIVRDNCISPGYFCDESQRVCHRKQPIGSACTYDVECSTHHCGLDSTCVRSLNMPLGVAAWHWVAISVIVVSAMIATCTLLTLLHKRHRRQEEKELREYYVDQISLRRAIIALHTAAAETYAEKNKYFDEDDDMVH
ncbi:hypothetical protein FPV67DRAFT_927665 [Lyophyllum atratum]|nr:hypothetical protein FPV67DRAFT_927665 [Lyophyllum atratum]